MEEIKKFDSGWRKVSLRIVKKTGILPVFVIKKIRIKRKNIKCEDTNVMDERALLIKSISGLKECVNVRII